MPRAFAQTRHTRRSQGQNLATQLRFVEDAELFRTYRTYSVSVEMGCKRILTESLRYGLIRRQIEPIWGRYAAFVSFWFDV